MASNLVAESSENGFFPSSRGQKSKLKEGNGAMAPWKVQRKTPSLWLPISDSSVSSVGCGQVTSVSLLLPPCHLLPVLEG